MVLLYFTTNKSFNDKKIGLITVYDIWFTVIPNNRTYGGPPHAHYVFVGSVVETLS